MMMRLEGWPHAVRAVLFVLLALAVTGLMSRGEMFKRVDADMSDMHARLTALQEDFKDVVVIDLDEDSITKLESRLGPWPYDREVYALVTQWLLRARARAVGFDILFAESRAGDGAFAAALDRHVVLATVSLPYSFERDAAYRARLAERSWGEADKGALFALGDVTLPRAELTQRASIGLVSAPVDGDGILRRVPLMYSVYGRAVPGFALALIHAGGPAPQAQFDDGELKVAGGRWPVSAHGEMLLRYPVSLAGLRTVPFYQAALAASGVAGLEPLTASFKNKIVVIGSSSAALGDFVETPLGRMPGVKAQALITQLALSGHALKPPHWAWQLTLLALALVMVLAPGHPRFQGNTWVYWGAFPLVVVVVGFFATLLVARGQAVGLLFALLSALLTYLAGIAYRQMQLYRANQQLEWEKRAALQADRLKSQFLSHITHELRTPLTAIMGFNNINWHGDELGREQRIANSEIVDRNCQHMLSLVNNLLDQAKIEAGQLAIQRHPDKPHAVIRDAVATVSPLLKGKPVKLRTDDIDVPETLSIDAFRLRQILLNLLSNAIKFTESGEIAVVSTWQDGHLTMAVVDSGPGMPPQALSRLFSAFAQADDGVAAKHGGTGLGLTISRNLARLMGGEITVRSTVGQGSVFTVTLEAPLADAAQAKALAPLAGVQVLSGVVLLAEDKPDVRALFVRQLEQLGLTVLQAEDGQKAIEIALARRPDVVLMDMEMPLVAGAEATRTLRMCGFSAPIVAVTAHKSDDEKKRALAAGCNNVIEKPLSRATLLSVLFTALAPKARTGKAREPS